MDGQIYESLDYKQKTQARQQSSVTVKARNLQTNKIANHTFKGSEDLSEADLDKRTVQFLYRDGDRLYFMDQHDFNQYDLKAQILIDKIPYLVEGQNIILILIEGQPLTVELPKNVYLEVKLAEQAVRGDTSTAVLKNVTLSTGLVARVPAFIKVGDIISIDTANGTYRGRQK